jgi:hypothetical protein
MRQATLVVCDEIQFSLSGKITAIGIYTGDIAIMADGVRQNQLCFLFLLESEIAEQPSESISVSVTLPGHGEIKGTTPIFPVQEWPAERTRWYFRFPLLGQFLLLRPGRIEARVFIDGDEIGVTAPWITVAPVSADPSTATAP